PFEIQTKPRRKRVPRKHHRKGSVLPLDNRPLNIHKSRKVTNVVAFRRNVPPGS
ncbi:unnamed protein product, partial [Pocillopora meandrina]